MRIVKPTLMAVARLEARLALLMPPGAEVAVQRVLADAPGRAPELAVETIPSVAFAMEFAMTGVVAVIVTAGAAFAIPVLSVGMAVLAPVALFALMWLGVLRFLLAPTFFLAGLVLNPIAKLVLGV